ncbi:hypothetical protein EON83_27090 [bacterium]|nr:MAG: hypothetical protein EON83_27090 [bacterium]
MSLVPEFLQSFQSKPVIVEPTEIDGGGPLRIQSFWGFDSIPTSQKNWLAGNTVQVFEPMLGGKCRVWEITASVGVPFDVERAEMEGKVLPAYAVNDLDGAMAELGYGAGEWNVTGGPMLTYTLTPDAPTLAAILEHFREAGMDVEGVLAAV